MDETKKFNDYFKNEEIMKLLANSDRFDVTASGAAEIAGDINNALKNGGIVEKCIQENGSWKQASQLSFSCADCNENGIIINFGEDYTDTLPYNEMPKISFLGNGKSRGVYVSRGGYSKRQQAVYLVEGK